MAYALETRRPIGDSEGSGVNLDKKAPRGAKKPKPPKKPKAPKQPRGKKAPPTKTSLNLYYKPDTGRKASTAILYILFGLSILALLGKLLVYDLYMEKLRTQDEANAAQYRLNEINSRIADYDEVKQKYTIYKATDEELDQLDRLELLAVVERVTKGRAHITTVTLNGDSTQILISGLTLAEASEIVKGFESSDLVTDVRMNTAAKNQSGVTDENYVTATMTVDFGKPEPTPQPTVPVP